ncbi:hypothetical protein [Microbulbifer sp.]|uniref:hypothetical protein n=1 Tax=Microbulbifer sp. TaxID=1908541 RepID=UPI003F342B98
MTGWLPLIIILFAVVLVVGPVMWLKPSARDQRLAALRSRASREGLTVQMKSLPAAEGQGSAAVYFTRWGDTRRLQTGWVLERQRGDHEMNFAGHWDWRNGRAAPQAAWGPLRELLAALPEDAIAIVGAETGLGVQWRESSGDRGMTALEKALEASRRPIEEAIRQPRNSTQ